MKSRLRIILQRAADAIDNLANSAITPEMLDAAEDLLHTLTTGERPPPKGLYELCALAFDTTRDDAKLRLLRAAYGGKSQVMAMPANDDAEMIAQWIEGYEAEPMNAAIIAQAIRAGRWRAS